MGPVFALMKQNQKMLVYGVVALVVLGAVAWLASKPATAPWSSPSPTPTPSVSAKVSPGTSYKTPTPAPVVGMPKSYGDALALYQDKRFQFDMYCQANPRSIAISAGSSVMIDNRSGDTRTFAVGGVYFTLPGYGWKIVTPTAKTLPANVYIDCGSSRNVGTIVLQK